MKSIKDGAGKYWDLRGEVGAMRFLVVADLKMKKFMHPNNLPVLKLGLRKSLGMLEAIR